MPASTRKTTDAAPTEAPEAVAAQAAAPEAPVAEETPAAEPAEAPAVEEVRAPVNVTFNGFAQSSVALIGLCEPGTTYTVPAAVADELCGGDSPQFTRATTA
jgi:hypothetical protein